MSQRNETKKVSSGIVTAQDSIRATSKIIENGYLLMSGSFVQLPPTAITQLLMVLTSDFDISSILSLTHFKMGIYVQSTILNFSITFHLLKKYVFRHRHV